MGQLVLSRKTGEKILIGDDITITVVRIGPNVVRIGIEAPRNLNVLREELAEWEDDDKPPLPSARRRGEGRD